MTGKWKAMGKDSQRDVMVCPPIIESKELRKNE